MRYVKDAAFREHDKLTPRKVCLSKRKQEAIIGAILRYGLRQSFPKILPKGPK